MCEATLPQDRGRKDMLIISLTLYEASTINRHLEIWLKKIGE